MGGESRDGRRRLPFTETDPFGIRLRKAGPNLAVVTVWIRWHAEWVMEFSHVYEAECHTHTLHPHE